MQRGKNSRRLAASGREQQAHRQPHGVRRTDRQRRKPHPKDKAPSLKGKLQTGDRVGKVNMKADLRPGVNKGERGTPGKRAQP